MIYFHQAGLGFQKSEAACDFGCYCDIVEVLDDQYANRHVVLFDDGRMLRYDRIHWIDEFGRLMGSKFSKKPKWVKNRNSPELLSALEFDAYWHRALKSSLWEQQQMRSLTDNYQQPTYL